MSLRAVAREVRLEDANRECLDDDSHQDWMPALESF
jgi:hypothetical protein